MNRMPTAIATYSGPEAYKKMVAMMPASDGAFPVYQQLLGKIEKGKHRIIEMGGIPHEIEVDPDAVKEWCENEGRPVCRQSLSEYIMLQMARRNGGSNN